MKLLQKFVSSNVIEEVRGRSRNFKHDNCCLYCFVTQPGPFNFVDETSTPNKRGPKKIATPTLGKRKRREPKLPSDEDCALFANEYASMSFDEYALSPVALSGGADDRRRKKGECGGQRKGDQECGGQRKGKYGGRRKGDQECGGQRKRSQECGDLEVSGMELGSPLKRSRQSDCVPVPPATAVAAVSSSKDLLLSDGGKSDGGGGGSQGEEPAAPALVARVSKEVTLNR